LASMASFCCLSLLPAVFLHISLEEKLKAVTAFGYALSTASILLQYIHGGVLLTDRSRSSLLLLSIGFVLLSLGAWLWTERAMRRSGGRSIPNRVTFISLAIFASSFLHFQAGHTSGIWIGEALWHHAVIPIALIVLLHDYRFLLLDVFARFVASSCWIAAWLWALVLLDGKLHLWQAAAHSGFYRGIIWTFLCSLLFVFAQSLRYLQIVFTRVVFRRPPLGNLLEYLRSLSAQLEQALLEDAAAKIASYYQSGRWRVLRHAAGEEDEHLSPRQVDRQLDPEAEWARVAIPIRFLRGDGCTILLGPRAGGRRLLSEDLLALRRVQAVLLERIERFRNEEMQRSVGHAELRALQAQINPHFLFNALNTLYGTIGRESAEARNLVLNLAEIFRARLQSSRNYVTLSEELDLVRAYLAIEELRLGNRLEAEISVDESLKSVIIPILTIQPLVENAVRHGMSAAGDVYLKLAATITDMGIKISVTDHGPGFTPDRASSHPGVGLSNIRQRLALCYGQAADLQIRSSSRGSSVSFIVPAAQVLQSQPASAPEPLTSVKS
ncbi:MAG TPA: histidine kinase, partial [Bryobacteraceae bacterium]|nr:histidine kinase [Bryobacteraceae bacterium]